MLLKKQQWKQKSLPLKLLLLPPLKQRKQQQWRKQQKQQQQQETRARTRKSMLCHNLSWNCHFLLDIDYLELTVSYRRPNAANWGGLLGNLPNLLAQIHP